MSYLHKNLNLERLYNIDKQLKNYYCIPNSDTFFCHKLDSTLIVRDNGFQFYKQKLDLTYSLEKQWLPFLNSITEWKQTYLFDIDSISDINRINDRSFKLYSNFDTLLRRNFLRNNISFAAFLSFPEILLKGRREIKPNLNGALCIWEILANMGKFSSLRWMWKIYSQEEYQEMVERSSIFAGLIYQYGKSNYSKAIYYFNIAESYSKLLPTEFYKLKIDYLKNNIGKR